MADLGHSRSVSRRVRSSFFLLLFLYERVYRIFYILYFDQLYPFPAALDEE